MSNKFKGSSGSGSSKFESGKSESSKYGDSEKSIPDTMMTATATTTITVTREDGREEAGAGVGAVAVAAAVEGRGKPNLDKGVGGGRQKGEDVLRLFSSSPSSSSPSSYPRQCSGDDNVLKGVPATSSDVRSQITSGTTRKVSFPLSSSASCFAT